MDAVLKRAYQSRELMLKRSATPPGRY